MSKGRPAICEVRNGVRRPVPNTIGDVVWGICASLPQPPKRKEVIALAYEKNILPGTSSCRFNDYRRFHAP